MKTASLMELFESPLAKSPRRTANITIISITSIVTAELAKLVRDPVRILVALRIDQTGSGTVLSVATHPGSFNIVADNAWS